eukprot:1681721-Pyramimonas_sp.AAC.1
MRGDLHEHALLLRSYLQRARSRHGKAVPSKASFGLPDGGIVCQPEHPKTDWKITARAAAFLRGVFCRRHLR